MRALSLLSLAALIACGGRSSKDAAVPPDTASVEVDTLPVRFDGRQGASGDLRIVEAVFRAASYAPGDSIRIGVTAYLPADTAGVRWNSKVESIVGERGAYYSGAPWSLLGAHSNLPNTVKRDSFYVARPAPGVTWTYRGCVQTVKTGQPASAWVCKRFIYTRPQTPPQPPDSVVVDSNAIRVARIFVTPPSLNLRPASAACLKITPDSARWADPPMYKTAKSACRVTETLASGATRTTPMIQSFCAFAQFRDGHWELTTQSKVIGRCVAEFPSVVDGSALGASFAPGEPIRIRSLVRLASR